MRDTELSASTFYFQLYTLLANMIVVIRHEVHRAWVAGELLYNTCLHYITADLLSYLPEEDIILKYRYKKVWSTYMTQKGIKDKKAALLNEFPIIFKFNRAMLRTNKPLTKTLKHCFILWNLVLNVARKLSDLSLQNTKIKRLQPHWSE